MSLTPEERTHYINDYRERYNKELEPVGFEAPTPKVGQTVGGYRRRACQTFADSLLPQTNPFAKAEWRDMDFTTFKIMEPQLLKECVVEYQNPANVPKGHLREFHPTNRDAGLKTNCFIGQDHFIKLPNFGCQTPMLGGYRPGRRAFFRNQIDDRGRDLRWNRVP